jgi:small basic protein (TIGR04137 family)
MHPPPTHSPQTFQTVQIEELVSSTNSAPTSFYAARIEAGNLEHERLEQSSLPSLTQAVIGIARGRFSEYNFLMSLHRSLRSGGSTAAKRNVLKRFERVTLLKKRGQWKAGMKSTGLPKTKPE